MNCEQQIKILSLTNLLQSDPLTIQMRALYSGVGQEVSAL